MNSKIDNYFASIDVPDNIDDAIKSGINEAKKKKHRRKMYLRAASAAASILFVIFLFCIKVNNNSIANKNEAITKSALPLVGSVDKLNKLLDNNNHQFKGKVMISENVKNAKMNSKNAPSTTGNPENKAADYSSTNLQVQGVDEDDTVKTDGRYIFSAVHNKVNIVEALPANNMKNINSVTVDNNDISGIYLSEKYLIVISGLHPNGTRVIFNGSMKQSGINNNNSETKISVFDISNINEIKKIREISSCGNYITSRMIASKLYFITEKNIIYDYEKHEVTGNYLPYYKDSLRNNSTVTIDLNKTPYFPDSSVSDFICIGTMDVNNLGKDIAYSAFLGSSDCVYVSKESMYVADSIYKESIISSSDSTKIYKFSFDNGAVKFTGKAEIAGTVLNEFSMDENNGYLRVASTEGNYVVGSSSQKNDIFILDKSMTVVGKINNIEPGEKIYAARFIGDKAYVVTYKNTDPLLVIDLKNPASPVILGELKIPGFSTYLQAYDDTHLIGIGMDTTAENNNIIRTRGVKLSLFDISNLSSPKELSSVKIDTDYSSSEALYNHKAFLFSKAKSIIAFPAITYNADNSQFTGAYVYNINLTNGITYKGRITHSDTQTNQSPINLYNTQITRILYVDDNLYTISNSEIKANKISDLSEVGEVRFK